MKFTPNYLLIVQDLITHPKIIPDSRYAPMQSILTRVSHYPECDVMISRQQIQVLVVICDISISQCTPYS